MNIILLVVCIIGAVILLGKNKHEGKTINIWYMIGEGPKLGVDLLWFKTKMNFQAPLTNSSEFFSSKALFTNKRAKY